MLKFGRFFDGYLDFFNVVWVCLVGNIWRWQVGWRRSDRNGDNDDKVTRFQFGSF